jgi:citronellol/citronellal dehydrogenase
MENQFKGKTVFITGASRGIGKAIGLHLAKAGANIVIAAKTAEPHPKLEGTIHTAAAEMITAGGRALALQCDIRNEEEIVASVATAVQHFGGIDILVNNASAINVSPPSLLPLKQFDLMMNINPRGTYLVARHCIPHLRKSTHAHILTLSPPLNYDLQWMTHAPYTLSKYGMTMITLGLSQELKKEGIAANTLWPKTVIATAAVQNLLGGDAVMKRSRKPEIVADAAYSILSKPPLTCTGNCFIDEDVLRGEGITDFNQYAVDLSVELMQDIFL